MHKNKKILYLPQIERSPLIQLPISPTPLIGRKEELAAAQQMLLRPDVRLLTLVGTAGIGKTRLSLEIATLVGRTLAVGVVFIPLAPITDSALVIPTIAQVLEVKEAVGLSFFDQLKLYLQDKQLLMLLDNFEQVIGAAPQVAEFLASCPHLKLLVTSREVLHIRGEHQFPLTSLALPDLKHLPDTKSLSHYAAVTLFMQRAVSVKPNFVLTETNAAVIAEICIHLDGLPLAIELAAARIKLLSPQALLARMDRRLQILTDGPRDLPERQQTLRYTIKWSYDLLTMSEQRLFRWFSAFVGGCTLTAIQCSSADWGATEESVLKDVMSLLDKNLLQHVEVVNDEPRLKMLETIREYSLECLEAEGELAAGRLSHANYYLAFVEEAEPELRRSQQALWLERLEREQENLRAALSWLIEQTDSAEQLEKALRLSSVLWRFWYVRGYFTEGRQWLKRTLTASKNVEVPVSVRAKALHAAGLLALYHDRSSEAEILCCESLALYQQINERSNTAALLRSLGIIAWVHARYAEAYTLVEGSLNILKEVGETDQYHTASGLIILANIALTQGNYDRAYMQTGEALALHRATNNTWYIAYSLNLLAQIELNRGDYTHTRLLLDESFKLSQEVDYKIGIAYAHYLLAQLVLRQGDIAAARELAEQGLLICRQMGNKEGMTEALAFLAIVAALQEEREVAHSYAQESMKISLTLGDKALIATSLEVLGVAYAAQVQYARAASIWGAAERLRSTIGAPMSQTCRASYAHFEQIARMRLGEGSFTTFWSQGQTLTPERAITVQYPETDFLSGTEGKIANVPVVSKDMVSQHAKKGLDTPTSSEELTHREIEVLHLVAEGLTNAQIATKLVISPRTVNAHLRSIYSKLELSSRIAVTRYALDHHLL